jgi:hypothetical protein
MEQGWDGGETSHFGPLAQWQRKFYAKIRWTKHQGVGRDASYPATILVDLKVARVYTDFDPTAPVAESVHPSFCAVHQYPAKQVFIVKVQ